MQKTCTYQYQGKAHAPAPGVWALIFTKLRLFVFHLGVLSAFATISAAQQISTLSSTPDTSSLATRLANARAALQANDLASAEAEIRDAVKAYPQSSDAMYLWARVLEVKDNPTESLKVFTQAAAIHSPGSEDLRLVGLDYILLNDTTDAIHWLSESVKMDPSKAEAWYDLGRAQMTSGDYIQAETTMHRALSLSPHMVKAEDNLGVILETQSRPSEAALAYQNALAWQSTDPHPSEQPYLNYGLLLINQADSQRALPLLQKAVDLAPKDPRCFEGLARALNNTGKQRDAADMMSRAITLDPNNPRLHFQLGQIYRHLGETNLATEELLKSRQLYGQHSSEPNRGK